jgi:hypothetical protein
MDEMERIETAEERVLDWIIAAIGYVGVVYFIVERFS